MFFGVTQALDPARPRAGSSGGWCKGPRQPGPGGVVRSWVVWAPWQLKSGKDLSWSQEPVQETWPLPSIESAVLSVW